MRTEHLTRGEHLAATTALLQRARLADPMAGMWEAADLQWWSRLPRMSDDVPLPIWFDDDGPVGAVVLTDWTRAWQADALVVPGTVALDVVWRGVLDALAVAAPPSVEVLAQGGDHDLVELLLRDGFEADESTSGTTWMDATSRPPVAPVPEGYRLVDRTERAGTPHPMRMRNGEEVETRLRRCSLYDPGLDLALETADGESVGYALFWSDPVTGVGLLEPMRVEDDHQRRGLARALLTEGLDRLAGRGARRLKVGFDGDAGRNLYLSAGFVLTSTDITFRR